MPAHFRLWDNGGRTADRYTIMDARPYPPKEYPGPWRYGVNFSENPYHPQGVGMGVEMDSRDWAANFRDNFRSWGKRLKTVATLSPQARKLVCEDFLPQQKATKAQLSALGCFAKVVKRR